MEERRGRQAHPPGPGFQGETRHRVKERRRHTAAARASEDANAISTCPATLPYVLVDVSSASTASISAAMMVCAIPG